VVKKKASPRNQKTRAQETAKTRRSKNIMSITAITTWIPTATLILDNFISSKTNKLINSKWQTNLHKLQAYLARMKMKGEADNLD